MNRKSFIHFAELGAVTEAWLLRCLSCDQLISKHSLKSSMFVNGNCLSVSNYYVRF